MFKPKKSLFKLQSKTFYYRNVDLTRNTDFFLNTGYNLMAENLGSNLTFRESLWLLTKPRLKSNLKQIYLDLLTAISTANVDFFKTKVEPSLQAKIFQDLASIYASDNSISISKGTSTTVNLKNIYYFQNIHRDREQNKVAANNEISTLSTKKITFGVSDNPVFIRKQDKPRMRAKFEQSKHFSQMEGVLKSLLEIEFYQLYADEKFGVNLQGEKYRLARSVIEALKRASEKGESVPAHLKEKFGDFDSKKEAYVQEKSRGIDLFEFFKNQHPKAFSDLFESEILSSKVSLGGFRNWLLKKARFSKVKYTTIALDFEVLTDKYLEIKDSDGEFVLYSQTDYKTEIGNRKEFDDEIDEESYNLQLTPDKWDLKNDHFRQKHVIRVEFFQKRGKKLDLTDWIITDVDGILKGNRHFKLNTE